MSDQSDTDRRDWWWLDDVTSLAIITLVLLGIVTAVAAFVYGVATGAIDLGADVQFVGTVDISAIIYGTVVFIAYLIYLALTDIYGQDDVEQSTEQFTETADQASDFTDE